MTKWTTQRCGELQKVERIITLVATAQAANNFLARMQQALELAQYIRDDTDFFQFLRDLAIADREKEQHASSGEA